MLVTYSTSFGFVVWAVHSGEPEKALAKYPTVGLAVEWACAHCPADEKVELSGGAVVAARRQAAQLI